jgi:hypothetical protein
VVAAHHVGGPVQAQVLEAGRGQAGGVALRAQDHDRLVVAPHLGEPVRAARVEAPLEHVALDDQRPGDLTLLLALGGRAVVDQQAAAGDHGRGLRRLHAPEPGPRLVEEPVDGGAHLDAPRARGANRSGSPGGE